ncbi:MAG: Ferredoxin, 2Fe-2S [Syntrophaceae bacterium PtaB.Bin038]|jgi:(2Fe-2S) ferredoxin|nr:MAG: Ferredoxin, 2Fe-2S [Syntrophaceae bacterium PtaB.Bin038]
MKKETSPYTCHVFVCTNDRHGERKSCADGNGNARLKEHLKNGVQSRGWKGRVRVSSAGCMGLCGRGPNVMVYPQKVWFAGASPEDGEKILGEIARLLSAEEEGATR